MSLFVFGSTLKTLGEVLIGLTAMLVHHRFWKEHKINKKVYLEMKREQFVGLAGILCIIIGHLFEAYSY